MSLTEQLRKAVLDHLKECNPAHTPKLCAMIASAEGYRKAESMIIDLALSAETSIGAAIAHLESELP